MSDPGDWDEIQGKRGGLWEYQDAGGAKVGGTWVRHDKAYINDGGTWKVKFDYCKCQARGGCTCENVLVCACNTQCTCNSRGCSCNSVYTTPDDTGLCPDDNRTCSGVDCGWYGGCDCFGRCCDCMDRTGTTVCSSVNVGCNCVSDGAPPYNCPCNVYIGCNCDNRGTF